MKRIKKNKKGSIADMIISFSFLLILIITGAIALFIFGSFNTAWQENTQVNEISKEASQDHNDRMVNIMDGAIVLFFFITWIVAVVTGFYNDSNPIFFGLFILISIISLIGIVGINLALPALQDSALSTYMDMMPIASFIVNNSIWFAVAYMLSVGGALYFKIANRE